MPYWDDLEHNDPEEVDGPDDVTLPSTMHHMQAKAELNLLIRAGCITDDEASQVMRDWKASQKMEDDSELRAAVGELESRGLIDGERADGIREQLSG